MVGVIICRSCKAEAHPLRAGYYATGCDCVPLELVELPARKAPGTIDVDHETERMTRLFAVEARGEADWLSNASGADAKTCRAMAIKALQRAAMKLEAQK